MTAERLGLAARLGMAWRAPAASWRLEWSVAPSEGRIAAVAFGVAACLTLGRLAAGADGAPGGQEPLSFASATILVGLSFGVLGLYLVAALMNLAARACGGQGGWAATRLALFWSGLAAGPALMLGPMIAALAGLPQIGSLLGGAAWAALLAPMLAEAQGIRVRGVAAVFLILALGALALTNFD